MKYAEDQPYWDTTVHQQKSLGEIHEMLEEFGAQGIMAMTGEANGVYTWVIRYQWEGKAYRFLFKPLPCRFPHQVTSITETKTVNGEKKKTTKKRANEEQARYQMGRRAYWLVKGILTAALDEPAVLFGFLELPGASKSGQLPATAAEVNVDTLTGQLPDMPVLYLEDGRS